MRYAGTLRAAGREYHTVSIGAVWRKLWKQRLPNCYFYNYCGYDVRVVCPPAGWMAVILKNGAVRLKIYGESDVDVAGEAMATIDRVLEREWTG